MNLPERAVNANLAQMHTFGLPSHASRLVLLTDRAHFSTLLDEYDAGEDCLLGEGSNTVFVKPLFEGTVWVIATQGSQYLGMLGACHLFKVEAGTNWHSWVEWSVAAGFPGLENLALIPGTVGAAPVQNIGAYGLELESRIRSVECLDLTSGVTTEMTLQDCQFGYRDSIFKNELNGKVLITSVTFALPVEWTPVLGYADLEQRVQQKGGANPLNIMKAVCEIRTAKLPDPARLGNAGSFFKNPLALADRVKTLKSQYPMMPVYPAGEGLGKLAAGWLIDQCGLKGRKIGGVQVYPKQALVLVNTGQGRAEELQSLIAEIVGAVEKKFGLTLEPEPNLR